MSETEEKTAANDANPALKTAGDFIAGVLGNMAIKDSLSGSDVPLPVKNVEIATDTMRGQDGVLKQSLHFKVEGTENAELNQAAILKSAEAVFARIPSLAQHFTFGDAPTAEKPLAAVHNWRDDRILDIKFDLPQGIEPASVVKEILTMAQGASLSTQAAALAAEAPPVLGPATQRVVEGRAAANDQGMAQGAA